MRILVVSPSAPVPADTGGRLRVLRCIQALAKTDDVTVCTLVENPLQEASLREYERFHVHVVGVRHRRGRVGAALLGVLRGEPMHVARYRSKAMLAAVGDLLRQGQFDVIWCHFLHTARNIPQTHVPMVLDLQNLDEAVWSRLAANARNPPLRLFAMLNVRQWSRFQQEQFGRFRVILAPSPEEVTQVTRLVNPSTAVWLAPNGVTATPLVVRRPDDGVTKIVFCAAMHVRMNEDAALWLVKEIWPAVVSAIPSAELWLVGGHPSRRLQAASARPGIKLTGWVPEVETYYDRATAAIVPLRYGGGTKLKTLEAMNLGVPVVATEVGTQGLGLQDGVHALISNTAEGLAERLVRIAREPLLGNDLAVAARTLVVNQYQWDRLYGSIRERLQTSLQSDVAPQF